MIECEDGGIAIVGTSDGDDGSLESHGWFFKVNETGHLQWSHIYQIAISLRAMGECDDGDFGLTGRQLEPFGYGDVCLIRTNSIGSIRWTESYGLDHNFERGKSLLYLSDDSFVISASRSKASLKVELALRLFLQS